jgi:hypothetical protein
MGASASATRTRNELTVDTSNMLEVTTDYVQKNSSKIQLTNTNVQNLYLENGPTGVMGNVDITQRININEQVSGDLSASSISNLETDLKNKVDSTIDQSVKNKQGFFSLGINVSVTDTQNKNTYKTAMKTAITQTMTVDNYSQIVRDTVNLQTGRVINNGRLGNVKVDQKIVARTVATNVMNSIITNTNKVLQDSNSQLRVKQQTENEKKGISELFSGNGLYVSGSSCICCCILLIVIAMIAMSDAGQNAISAAATRGRM